MENLLRAKESMVKIIDCAQGTDEWLNARLGIATASNFSKVVTNEGSKSKQFNQYAFQLASEIITEFQEESYSNAAMIRGNELEPEARKEYQESTLSVVKQTGFMLCDHYGYSPDGLIGDDGLIEIKCPSQAIHAKYMFNNKLPAEYKAQVQGGLLVSARKWCDFVSYHPGFEYKYRLFVIRVYRDDEFIEKLEIALNQLDELKRDIVSGIRNTILV